MTPKQAILNECRYCNNTISFHGCSSEICKLNDPTIPHIKRIKGHCLTCVPENSVFGVKDCSGRVLIGDEVRICPLHVFRAGKNPRRQAASKKDSAVRGLKLTKFQFKSKKMTNSMSLASKVQKHE